MRGEGYVCQWSESRITQITRISRIIEAVQRDEDAFVHLKISTSEET